MTDSKADAASSSRVNYSSWSNADLVGRIEDLERQLNLRAANSATSESRAEPVTQSSAQPENETDWEIPITGKSIHEQQPPSAARSARPGKPLRHLDPSKYNTRFIALKFAYLGQRYNGFEHTNGIVTPLPTIEEELYRALRRARLIFPRYMDRESAFDDQDGDERRNMLPYSIDWEGCQYSKCGRTDRGVSAFGQVIGIRLRSAKPKRSAKTKSKEVLTPATPPPASVETSDAQGEDPFAALHVSDTESASEGEEDEKEDPDWDDIADELPYIHILNKLLPKDIRVLAWCPHPPADFDARFSCRGRQYRYLFTQPAFSPTPGTSGLLNNQQSSNGSSDPRSREGWLDIDAMREGARHFLGSHDFRNFCKIDPSKQITNFVRYISHIDIEPAAEPLDYLEKAEFRPFQTNTHNRTTGSRHDDSAVKVYSLTLHGSAFLWHQVRHMVAILFLIGQGMESPSIIRELLDIEKNPRRPTYEIASDAPLVLWDCIFPETDKDGRQLEWIYPDDQRMSKAEPNKGNVKFGLGGVVDSMWTIWRQRKIDEILAGSLLDMTVKLGRDENAPLTDGEGHKRSQKLFYGGNEPRYGGKYTPLLQRSRMDSADTTNARYMANRGARRAAKREARANADRETAMDE